MAFFDATESFEAALSEVEHLLDCAERSQKVRHDYLTYLKAAIVLLGAKFEAFAESIVENYVDRLGDLTPKAKHLPRDLRISSTTHLLNQCLNGPNFSAKPLAISNLQAAAALWNDDDQHRALTVSNKFNYGKHGSSEVRSLFLRIGITDILDECQISATENSTMLGSAPLRISIAADIDSFTNIRNNIIHNDSSPNTTHQQIHGYKEKFWEFGYMVDLRLDRELENVKTSIASNP